jgi:hypothetical protein
MRAISEGNQKATSGVEEVKNKALTIVPGYNSYYTTIPD